METLRDSQLIKDCLSGKEEAWNVFINRFSKLVYYSINRTVNSYCPTLEREDIEDIYSDIFLSFVDNNYRKLRQFDTEKGCTLSSWVRLIAVRRTIDFLRKKKQHVSLDDVDDAGALKDSLRDNNPSVQLNLEISEHEKILEKAIQELPSSDLLFIELFYKRKLSPEEIASVLNVSVSTVYSKKTRLREKLEKIIKK